MQPTIANRKTLPGIDSDGILRELSTRQHLTPHRRLSDVVSEIVENVGACPVAAERAMGRLELDGSRSIGRLKRSELIQLARSMYRYWSQALAAGESDRSPATTSTESRPQPS